MKVDLLDRNMVDSDLGVVNAARCSFDKQSEWTYDCPDNDCNDLYHRRLRESDIKLVSYLAKNNHWTPFAHAQEVFKLDISDTEMLEFLLYANLSGFEWSKTIKYGPLTVRASLYAWYTNLQYLPQDIARDIGYVLQRKYLVSHDALNPKWTTNCQSPKGICRVQHITNPVFDEYISYTLRLHVPIFIKRQLETHRRNFVMTDIEDFSQNEVSRRYINSEPEIYYPKDWRFQSADKKQGSSDNILEWGSPDAILTNSNYYHNTQNSLMFYKAMNNRNIAHEQSRMILPLSTYTTFWWTGSLKSWKRMFNLRLDSHAQSETREITQLCYSVILSYT